MAFAAAFGSVVPQPTESQHVTDQGNAAMIFARADFVNVHGNAQPLGGSEWLDRVLPSRAGTAKSIAQRRFFAS